MLLACAHCRREVVIAAERLAFCPFCGRPFESETPSAMTSPDPGLTSPEANISSAPNQLGGYRLLRQLGEGGMGAVWEAEDSHGRRVALKLISPDLAASSEAVERFKQEGRLASSLSHPRCVFVIAADEEAGQPFIVMELMPGDTLRDEEIRPEMERRRRASRSWFGFQTEVIVDQFTTEILRLPGWANRTTPSHLSSDGQPEVLFSILGTGMAIMWGLMIVAAFVFRGGVSFWLAGIDIVRSDGRRAGRFRCAWRALLVWTPPFVLLLASLAVECLHPEWLGVPMGLWLMAVLLVVVYLGLALRWPERGPQDRLAGTFLVPR